MVLVQVVRLPGRFIFGSEVVGGVGQNNHAGGEDEGFDGGGRGSGSGEEVGGTGDVDVVEVLVGEGGVGAVGRGSVDDYFGLDFGDEGGDAGGVGEIGGFLDHIVEELLVWVAAGHVDLAAVGFAE